MTVSSSTNRASYSGNGSLTTFAYGFKVFDQDDLAVILRASNGTETVQTITTDYTVTGVGDVGGGNVVFGTAPASGVTVVILREMDLEQGLDLVPNDPFPAQSLENSLDKLTFMVQQHDEQLGRTIQASRTNVITGSEFVISAADRANKVFAFDSSGDVSITQEIGTFRGDWAASTAYVERDLVKDTTTNNVFIVNSAHTSSGSLPLTTNTNSAKYEKIIDITNPPGDLAVGGNISTSGSVTAGSFVIGSADINENDLEAIDSIIAGTVAASKAVVVDVNKDISSFRNLTATGDITFGGLSDGTITVTDILDEDDLTSNSATSLATQQSIKAYVDSQVGSFDTLAEILSNGNTTGGTNLSVSTGDDITFADSSKAIFGAGSDLQIYHDGLNSYIVDNGTGDLHLSAANFYITNAANTENHLSAIDNGAVTLYYDNAVKMATTSLGIDVTGTITFDGGVTTADFYFGDNDKAIFGAGDDLLIYSDGNSSIIEERSSTGSLYIQADQLFVKNSAGTENKAYFATDGAVNLYYDNALKLATTSTGVDITGTLTSDGLTVDTDAYRRLLLTYPDAFTSKLQIGFSNFYVQGSATNDRLTIANNSSGQTHFENQSKTSMVIDNSGDISFYEDTGTTPKFFWDASAERLGIGTSSPSRVAELYNTSNPALRINNGTDIADIGLASSAGAFASSSTSGALVLARQGANDINFATNGTNRVTIDSSGKVGIGTSSPAALLDLKHNSASTHLRLTENTSGNWSALGVDTSDNLRVYVNNSERMRIDSSGNLLVGTTSTPSTLLTATSGGGMAFDGTNDYLVVAREGAGSGYPVLRLNQTGVDGAIAEFRKDGSSVGSIGTKNNSLYIGSTTGSDSYLGFYSNSIIPTTSDGSDRNNAIDLGYTGSRFKDLYLSNSIDIDASAGARIKLTDTGTQAYSMGNTGTSFNIYNESQSSEAMRLDSSGNLLVGTTSYDSNVQGVGIGADGFFYVARQRNTANTSQVAGFNRKGTDGSIINLQKDGSTVGSIGTAGGRVYFADDSTNGITFSNSSAIMWPSNSSGGVVDNTMDIGSSSFRFDDIYATNGTIQTSDRNEKQDIEVLSDAETRVAQACKGLLRKFRWQDAVAEKGDDARIHFGIIAQDLQDAFAAEGLDAGRYAMFISSTWTDEETGEERTRLGVRYPELLAFIIAAI